MIGKLLRSDRPGAVLKEYQLVLARRVRDLRTHKGWTQERLAEATKVTRVCIVAVEGGKQNVSMDILIRLANALGSGAGNIAVGRRMILGGEMKNSGRNDYVIAAYSKQTAKQHHAESRNPTAGAASTEGDIVADGHLAELLGLDSAGVVGELLRNSLLNPVSALTSNRGKRVRAQLVSMAYRLVHGDGTASLVAAKQCRACADVVELIHAGSLIVDDIEDGSQLRRGQPALHVQYGMPLALNTGNWLYFWPFELLQQSGLPKDQLLLAYERYHRTLLRAHFGQAIDLGAKVQYLPQQAVSEICLAGMKLKTGALMGFSATFGGAIAGASEKVLSVLDEFGVDLGVALQMFDDLGNVIGKCDPLKRYEDLLLSRPSWVWACAAQESDPYAYEAFLAAVGLLPDATSLEKWFESHDLVEATRKSAREYLERAFVRLERRLAANEVAWSARAFNELRQLGEEIAVAYG